MSSAEPVDSALSASTRAVVLRYHQCWKYRDLDGVLALYHPEVEYHDFFQNRLFGLAQLRDYVADCMPRDPLELLEHTDRIRVDGDTAQYWDSPGRVATVVEMVKAGGDDFVEVSEQA